jgi:chromosome segregation ATPase
MLSEAQASAKEAKYQLDQAETENSKLRQQLSSSNRDLDERTQQLLLFQRSIGVLPQNSSSPGDWNALKTKTLQNLDLAKRLEEVTLALQIAEEQKASLERRLQNSSNWKDDLDQPSRPQWRTIDDAARSRSREASPLRALPSRLRDRTGSVSSFNSVTSRSEFDSNGSDDLAQRKHTQNLRNEIEELTTKLELSEMQRRRLESRSSAHSRTNSSDGDSSVIELRRLQRENVRLHELVDDQSEKLNSPASSKPGTPREQATSPQIRELEQSKQKLTEQQNKTLRELSNARVELDKIRTEKDAEYRKINALKQELEAEKAARKRENSLNESTKNEYKALKIRVEREAGKHAELEDIIRLHKSRAEDLQNKLEDAEIAAHNAMRSESFARGQLQEVEDALAAALNEQRKAEDAYINLQKELRALEGKVIPSLHPAYE